MNRRTFTAAISVLLLSSLADAPGVLAQNSAQSTNWTIDTNHSQVNFQIRHISVSTVRGSIGGITGNIVWDEKNPARSSVEATMKTSTVSTNNDRRDTDLKSDHFFDVQKYPTMTFKSTSVTRDSGKLQVIGDLTLNGITKSVTLDVDGPTAPQKGMGGKTVIGLSATGSLKRSDFNFGTKYPSAILGDDIKFTIDAEADQ